jgi:hypothetical protein
MAKVVAPGVSHELARASTGSATWNGSCPEASGEVGTFGGRLRGPWSRLVLPAGTEEHVVPPDRHGDTRSDDRSSCWTPRGRRGDPAARCLQSSSAAPRSGSMPGDRCQRSRGVPAPPADRRGCSPPGRLPIRDAPAHRRETARDRSATAAPPSAPGSIAGNPGATQGAPLMRRRTICPNRHPLMNHSMLATPSALPDDLLDTGATRGLLWPGVSRTWSSGSRRSSGARR